MNKPDYRRQMDRMISSLDGMPALLLHCCCAPCSSACLTELYPYFEITCFYYNPNITDENEYRKRYSELVRLVGLINDDFAPPVPITVKEGGYDPDVFLGMVSSEGLAGCPEGGRRCERCFDLRLRKTYEEASKGYDYFTTTLTISPLKDADLINRTGYAIAGEDSRTPMWLPSDFKKRDGFKKSVALSEKYGLYRQDYCGCIYSEKERHGS
ncbi:MAG: epoxyqueuosine reductase QueH [Lachnospiraceae bacterium]|nr:epoxyqueuosine reductase QueH [Lachnospiraceae bacterium]